MSFEKIFVVGGTGNIGTRVVQELLARDIPTTLYARNPSKISVQYDRLTIVQGDYDDLTALKDAINGHTRLFLLIADMNRMAALKKSIAEIAYSAGVKQIVDVSSLTVSAGGRRTYIGGAHKDAEDAVYKLEGRTGTFVALRPARFMNNAFLSDAMTVKYFGFIGDIVADDVPQAWISTDDIADLAVIILQEPVEKHGNAVYEMVGDSLTGAERAAVYSKVFGRNITHRVMSHKMRYTFTDRLLGLPHLMSYDFVHTMFHNYEGPTPALKIVLGRKPETLEEWLRKNEAAFRICSHRCTITFSSILSRGYSLVTGGRTSVSS